ncbi:SSFA2 isoform 9 [Pan troglodytes]|uniref:ITPR interacting domain containing 2 n=3 Tax=Hominidae TaxID=9604 RepID=F2Z295_HUMAN|nr:SSFA2 isoform 5 [Pan troglodytes]PNJ08830.1 SSFA2 isoform 4 [Pongo abelii]PNI86670.1 SSFA2 isoform 6 [Pan troglodytes]PNI86671.1 SSFA2 isoform 9 [Pan troglodytes]PNJ08831.1 SSFA2 isoform 5 [Pongo abelii]
MEEVLKMICHWELKPTTSMKVMLKLKTAIISWPKREDYSFIRKGEV